MAAVSRILVVGGGVGGLTAATALRQQGIAVDLVEINPDHSVYGVGIIQPNNTLRALDRIGLADECVRLGGAFPGWRIFDAHGGHIMDAPNHSDASPRHPPVNGITRPLLQRVLLEAARASGADIRTGVGIGTMADDGDGVDVSFTDGRAARYDFVIGSDGLYSEIRTRLFGSSPAPQFSGQAVWRYNFPRPAEVEWGHVYYGARTKVGLVPMSPDLMYMFLVTHEPGNPRMPREQLPALMRERLDGYAGLVAALRETITDADAVVYKPMEHLLLPAPWHKGRVIVIGDGAHATTPHLAQGAAMAIEDAVLLGELLGSDRPLADLLDEFMARRFDRAKFVIDCSTQIADWEMEQWAGIQNPAARPGQLLGEATHALMADY
jgi:2-polyprenyl-6-methoxyphenol hydroxylase-like FAD-dependent oxidoreductase